MTSTASFGEMRRSPRLRAVRALRQTSFFTARFLAVFGGIACFLLLALVCANAASRLFGYPIRGAVECSGILSAICSTLALGIAEINGNHITGGVAAGRMPALLRRLIHLICLAAGTVFFLFCAWEMLDIGLFALEFGETVDGADEFYPYLVLMCVPGFLGEAVILTCGFLTCLLTGKD